MDVEAIRESGVGQRVARILADRSLEAFDPALKVFFGSLVPVKPPFQVLRVRLHVPGVPPGRRRTLPSHELHRVRVDNGQRDLVLHGEDVSDLAVVLLRPSLIAVDDVDELRRNAQRRSGLSDATLENRADVQLATDLPDVDVLALEREGGTSGNHVQAFHAGQGIDDLLGNPVAEELLLRIATEVVEGQHGDRRHRPVGRGSR